jgi:hypothetical protein
MRINGKKGFAESDKAGNMQDGIRRELMPLHAINSWAGRDIPHRRKEKNITQTPSLGRG